jgi:hypothetical protein
MKFPPFIAKKTKPKQTQFTVRLKMNINTAYRKDYENSPPWMPKKQTQIKPSSCKAKAIALFSNFYAIFLAHLTQSLQSNPITRIFDPKTRFRSSNTPKTVFFKNSRPLKTKFHLFYTPGGIKMYKKLKLRVFSETKKTCKTLPVW